MSLCPGLISASSETTLCGSRATALRVSLEQIAADFGVHPMTLSKWMRQAKPLAGVNPNTANGLANCLDSGRLDQLRR
jgi:hypothetical protein